MPHGLVGPVEYNQVLMPAFLRQVMAVFSYIGFIEFHL